MARSKALSASKQPTGCDPSLTATKAREGHLKRTYGISLVQYFDLLQRQNNACAVCLRDRSEFSKNFCVDHNHVTGEVRGLLCIYCNKYLVGRHRDPELVRRIADYISQGTGWFVPPKKKKKRKRRVKVRCS